MPSFLSPPFLYLHVACTVGDLFIYWSHLHLKQGTDPYVGWNDYAYYIPVAMNLEPRLPGFAYGAPRLRATTAYAGHRHTVRIVNGSLRRWVPLAVLALFAATEFAAQYLFIATPFAQAVGIPDSALRFIEVGAPAWSGYQIRSYCMAGQESFPATPGMHTGCSTACPVTLNAGTRRCFYM